MDIFNVDRAPTRTTHLCTYSSSQNAVHKYSHSRNTRGSSRLTWCVKSSLSSQRHVSHVAAVATEHLHTISLTNITCPPTIFSLADLSRVRSPLVKLAPEVSSFRCPFFDRCWPRRKIGSARSSSGYPRGQEDAQARGSPCG